VNGNDTGQPIAHQWQRVGRAVYQRRSIRPHPQRQNQVRSQDRREWPPVELHRHGRGLGESGNQGMNIASDPGLVAVAERAGIEGHAKLRRRS